MQVSKRTAWAAAVGAALVLAVGGCDGWGDTKSDAPEPTGPNVVDGTNTKVIRMPDGFRNVVFSCFGTDGVFVTSRGDNVNPLTSSVDVVPNDPHCVG